MMTSSSTPFTSSQGVIQSSYPQPLDFCGGKVLPTSSKRFALSGINPNNNSGSSATNNLSSGAASHYQNLRIYYQLAF